MNNDLVERGALKEHIGSYAGMFTDELGFAVSMEAVLRGIDFAESVDAVEVVRCKDCKYHQIMEDKKSFMYWHNCKFWCADIVEDDFCSYGERKTDV